MITTIVSPSFSNTTYGQDPGFGATITQTGSSGPYPAMTGTVSLYNGASLIGEATVTSAAGTGMGTATFPVYYSLPAGTLTIVAEYSGDANYAASKGSGFLTVTKVPTGISSLNTPVSFCTNSSGPVGVEVNYTPAGSPPLPPTGTVTFVNTTASVTIGYAQLVPDNSPSSMATITASFAAAGTPNVSASYSGDANYASAGISDNITVNQASTTTNLTSSNPTSALCQPVTLYAQVSAVSPGAGVPTGTVTFTVNGTPGSPVTLSNGVASYVATGLMSGSNSVSAQYNGDPNFVMSSGSYTQTVGGSVNWPVNAAPAASDAWQAQVLQFGNALVDSLTAGLMVGAAQADAKQSTSCSCSCGCNDNNSKAGTCPTNFTYSSRTLNVKPIIVATLASDFCSSVPSSIDAQLTWNGAPQGTVTYGTTGHSAGDVYNLPLQVTSAVATTGNYPWSVAVAATVGTFIYGGTASGTMPVVTRVNSVSGAGWGLSGTLGIVPGSAALIDNGSGGTRYFTGTPTTLPYTFTSPLNDQGTLVQNADSSYTYTSKDQVQTNFDSTGLQMTQVDPNGLTQTFTYSSGQLSTITQPDGGVATFNYNGSGQMSTVQEPGGRMLTMSYDGSNNLTGIVDAAGNITTFTYNGSHQLINQQVGPINTTYTYSATNGSLVSIDQGLGSVTTIAAAAYQGLGASVALNASEAAAVVTDPLGNVTTTTLDSLGRVTQIVTADGSVQSWTLNAAGNPTTFTDQLGRVTSYGYNAAQDLTQIRYPDGTFGTFQYEATFHQLTQTQDALGNITTNTYDPTTGNQLTAVDALGFTTTFTWSNGLKQTTMDPLGRVTTMVWNSALRRELAQIDALGNITTFGYDLAGNQISVQDARGNITTSSYDGDRRLLTVTDALGGVMSNSYDGAGNLVTSTDQLGRTVTYQYDQRGWQTAVTEPISLQPVVKPGRMLAFQLAAPLGTLEAPPTRTTTTNYDVAGNVLYVTDPLGDIASYSYDVLNRPTAQIEAYGTAVQRTTTTSYDAVSNVIQSIDARATTTSYAYNVRNWQVQQTSAAGNLPLQQTTNTSYDAVGNVQTVTDPKGTVTSFGYDANYRQTQRVDAYGLAGLERTTTTMYDPVGNTQSETNAVGAVTSFGYDLDNRRILTIEALGSGVQRTTTINYDAVGNVQSTVNPRGVTTSYAYDPLNRRVNEIDGYGTGLQRTLTMAYDAVSNLLSTTNGLGVTTSFGFDALNRRVTQLDAYGTGLQRVSTINYDADDNVTSRTDPLGFVTAFAYDALKRRISVVSSDGGIATTGFDANDNVVAITDQLGHTSTFSYDVMNRKVTITDALGGVVTLNYDANNNLISLTDPVANQTQWQLDALNRQVQETDPLYNISTMAYDSVDRVTSATDKKKQLINYSYDLLNRETGETWIIGTITQNLLTFTYDPNNNMLTAANNTGTITRVYDSLDRLSTNADTFGTLVTNSYDAANNRTVIQDSFGGIVTRTFDQLNRMATMQYTGQSMALREDYAYSGRDQVTNQTRFSNLAGTTTVGFSTYSYDSVGRLTNLQHLNGSGSNIANFTNTYDLASRITVETLNGGLPTSYSYDITNQLTDDTLVTYAYDLNGNRETTGTFAYSTATANQLASDGIWNYFYDQNANLIQKVNIGSGEVFAFGYDNRNRMITVTDMASSGLQMQATYSYDALGQRIEKDVWTGGVATVTQMACDDGRRVWADLNGSSAIDLRYMRTEMLLELPARVSSGGTMDWLFADRMGSIRNVVDSTGAVIDTVTYDGYGNGTQGNVTAGGIYLWNGYRYDPETLLFRPDPSLDRLYGPSFGRWTSLDVSAFASDVNLFRYCFNDPTNGIDPFALSDIAIPRGRGAAPPVNIPAGRQAPAMPSVRNYDVGINPYYNVIVGLRAAYDGIIWNQVIAAEQQIGKRLDAELQAAQADRLFRENIRRTMGVIATTLGIPAFPEIQNAMCEFNFAWCIFGLDCRVQSALDDRYWSTYDRDGYLVPPGYEGTLSCLSCYLKCKKNKCWPFEQCPIGTGEAFFGPTPHRGRSPKWTDNAGLADLPAMKRDGKFDCAAYKARNPKR